MDRRYLLGAGSALLAAGAFSARAVVPQAAAKSTVPAFPRPSGPRSRVLIVNDLAGDVDGLFATVHALLSPSTDVRGIIGAGTGNMALTRKERAADAVARAWDLLRVMEFDDKIRVFEGAPEPWSARARPTLSLGVRTIIEEAMRTDTGLPLYVTVGCGLTEVASALAIEPRIARRFTLVWIGGEEQRAGRSSQPGLAGRGEYNFSIDRLAAQYVFNETTVPIWQVPSTAYAPCMVSIEELRAQVVPHGRVGRWLWERLCEAQRMLSSHGISIGETYTLGDNPLVVLTALTSWPPSSLDPPRFDQTNSSRYKERLASRLNPDGSYTSRPDGRLIRVYESIDTRLMFADFFQKLARAYPD